MQTLTADLAFSSFPHPVLMLFIKINPSERQAGHAQAAILQQGRRWAKQAVAEQAWLSKQPSMPSPHWSRLSEGVWLWMATALLTPGGSGDDMGVLCSLPAPTWGARHKQRSPERCLPACCCATGERERGRASPISSLLQVPQTSAQSDSPQEHCQ